MLRRTKKPKRPVRGKGRAAAQADERRARKTKRTLNKLTKRLKGIQRPTSGGKPMVDPKRKVGDMPLEVKPKKAPVQTPYPRGGGMAKGGAMKAKGMKAGGKMKAKGMRAGGKMKSKGYAKGGNVGQSDGCHNASRKSNDGEKGEKRGGPQRRKMAQGGAMKAKGMTKGGAMKAKGAQKGGMKRNMRAPVKKNSGLLWKVVAYLQSNIPYFKCWVRREYTHNHTEYHGEFLHAMAIAVTTMPTRLSQLPINFYGG